MKYFDWNAEKNKQLKRERDIEFEDILVAIDSGNLLDVLEHPNSKKYPGQKVFIVQVLEYVYRVPFVEDDTKIFLKTIIPSREDTAQYLHKKDK